ncbi:MAG: Do family serine endopeptidase [Spirochaetes bacterium]|nr:Do family serine endopeptidase [Spirochaetota bacterium]
MKRMYSKTFFLINLVLIGVIAGFGIAFFSLSGKGPSGTRSIVEAEGPGKPAASVEAALAQALSLQTAFNYVSETVLPSVVEVDVVETGKPSEGNGQDQLPWKFFFGPEDQQGDAPPAPNLERGLGSGVIVKRDGKTVYILTNNHVAGNADEITVKLNDEREFKASLVGRDERRDIALVKFETDSPDIKVASLGDSDAVKVGDWAIAIGSPLGLFQSVTAGIVSALGREGGPDNNLNDFIQTDAAINRGNSGGALVNVKGEIIGINTWIATPTGGNIGLGFAIPINNVKKAINDFITKGTVQYGWLGVRLLDLDKATAIEIGAPDRKGAFIEALFSGSPAFKAGVLPGDLIIAVNGKNIASKEELTRIVGDLRAGDKANFTVLRLGKEVKLLAVIDPRNEEIARDNSKLWPGVGVLSLNSDQIDKKKLPKDATGVFVASLTEKTPAAVVGLKFGDIVTGINDKPVKDAGDFYRLINDPQAKEIRFTIQREGQTLSTLALVRK